MFPSQLNLTKHILHLLRVPLRISIHIRSRNTKQRDDLLHPLRHFKRMRLSQGLKAKPAFVCPSVVLETVPSPFETCGADGAGILVPGEDAGFVDAKEVHEITLEG